jgi:hypothetical protein
MLEGEEWGGQTEKVFHFSPVLLSIDNNYQVYLLIAPLCSCK